MVKILQIDKKLNIWFGFDCQDNLYVKLFEVNTPEEEKHLYVWHKVSD